VGICRNIAVVLVGAEVNVNVALKAGGIGIILILTGLIGRSVGVAISLLGTDFNWKERVFCIIAYIPKATVQAAMGAVPLSLGVESGDIILGDCSISHINYCTVRSNRDSLFGRKVTNRETIV